MDYYTVKKDASAEITEKKSLFIGNVFFTSSEAEAKAKIDEIKKLYNNATHNVYAYSLRLFGTERMSDDNEPSGTAGLPVLQVIKKSGLIDVCIVVTRYFGGILLGAGGLVRAYSKAASLAVENAGKTPIILKTFFKLTYTYDLHNSITRMLSQENVKIISQDYTDKIIINAIMPSDCFLQLKMHLKEIFYTNLIIENMKEEYGRKMTGE